MRELNKRQVNGLYQIDMNECTIPDSKFKIAIQVNERGHNVYHLIHWRRFAIKLFHHNPVLLSVTEMHSLKKSFFISDIKSANHKQMIV